jgi:hypothetical protein
MGNQKPKCMDERAYALGVRMAQAGFSHEDNPYVGLNVPRQSKCWTAGFGSVQLCKSLKERVDESTVSERSSLRV